MIRPNSNDHSPEAVVLRTLGVDLDHDLLRALTDMLTDDRDRQGQDRYDEGYDAGLHEADEATRTALKDKYNAGYADGKELSDAERDRIYDEGYEAGKKDR